MRGNELRHDLNSCPPSAGSRTILTAPRIERARSRMSRVPVRPGSWIWKISGQSAAEATGPARCEIASWKQISQLGSAPPPARTARRWEAGAGCFARGRLVKHARYYWLLLAEGHLNRRLLADMRRRIWAFPLPSG